MLAELFHPLRTKNGSISKKSGLPRYSTDDHILFSGRYLGESIGEKGILAVRLGGGIFRTRKLCERAVDRYEAGLDVPQLVRRDRFRRYAEGALEYFEKYGSCRDGRGSIVESLEYWAWHHCAVDVVLLERARAVEGELVESTPQVTPQVELDVDVGLYRRCEALGFPFEVRPLLGPNGFIWRGSDGAELPSTSVGRAALEGRLERLEAANAS